MRGGGAGGSGNGAVGVAWRGAGETNGFARPKYFQLRIY